MKHSDSITKIIPALLKAQLDIKNVIRQAENKHFGSKFADLTTILDAIKSPLNANGIVLLQPISSSPEGVTVETMLIHESGEWLSECMFMPVNTSNPHHFGSACSYTRRYSLQSFVALPSEDDDGNKAADTEQPSSDFPAPGPPRNMKASDFTRHCTAMATSTKQDQLQKAFTVAVMEARKIGDEGAVQSFIRKKDDLKAMIESANKAEIAEGANNEL
jgi:hypothetical protein